MQLSEATSSPSLASLALLANAPAGQTAPSDGGLFAEIFAALAQTQQAPGQSAPAQPTASLNTNAPLITNTLDTEAEASAPPTPNTSNIMPATGSGDSQSAVSRLFATLGLAPVPQNASSNAVAPQSSGASSQPATPSRSPNPNALTPQTLPASSSAPQPASAAKPSAPPAKPSKKEPEPAHPAQNSQLPLIPIILPAPQTPEPAAMQSTTNSTSVQPFAARTTADQSTAPANNTAPAPNTGNLSFAMRIAVDSQPASDPKLQSTPEQPANTPASAAVPQSPDAVSPVAAISNHPQQQDEKPAPEQHTTNTAESLLTASAESTATAPAFEAHAAHTSQPAAPAPAAEIEPQQTASTNEPLRNMHIQLTGDNNQRVNVHLVDRGGELRLSVKSPDPTLAQTMQEHMPELTSRLEQQRYQTEVWMPKETASSSSSNNNSNSNGSSNPGDGNPEGRQNGQQQQQQNRPEWLDDLEDNPRRPQTTRRN